jgi:hypothetical protein
MSPDGPKCRVHLPAQVSQLAQEGEVGSERSVLDSPPSTPSAERRLDSRNLGSFDVVPALAWPFPPSKIEIGTVQLAAFAPTAALPTAPMINHQRGNLGERFGELC